MDLVLAVLLLLAGYSLGRLHEVRRTLKELKEIREDLAKLAAMVDE